MHRPSLHQIPRGDGYDKFVKDIFIAPEGWTFFELDFSAIEAVLVGYFAGSAAYTRFAKLGVHDYLASHLLKRPADLSWSDADLKAYFAEIKANHTPTRDIAKRVIHLSNYRGTPRRMHIEYPDTFPTIQSAETLQGFYYELFPEIPKWHWNLCERVDGTKRRRAEDPAEPLSPWSLGVCYARTPFGNRHEFYNVMDWEHKELPDGTKEWVRGLGDDAKRLISFLPQSTAAGIIKRAAIAVWREEPEIRESLRLLIHDSIVGECREEDLERHVDVINAIMCRPVPELPLDPSWGMGEALSIGVEAKAGRCWSEMKRVR